MKCDIKATDWDYLIGEGPPGQLGDPSFHLGGCMDTQTKIRTDIAGLRERLGDLTHTLSCLNQLLAVLENDLETVLDREERS